MKNTFRRNIKNWQHASECIIEKDILCSLKNGIDFKSMGSIYDVCSNKNDMHYFFMINNEIHNVSKKCVHLNLS